MNKVRSKVGNDEAEETRSIRLKLEQNREYLRETNENKNKEKWRGIQGFLSHISFSVAEYNTCELLLGL